jgi:Rrf2 family transcriptional regulator, cysteine metabolism repressor
VLRSQRGVKGGYSFARPAADITVLELVELLDGPVGGGAAGVFADAAEAARGVLGQSTVADVAEAESRATGAPMYHI